MSHHGLPVAQGRMVSERTVHKKEQKVCENFRGVSIKDNVLVYKLFPLIRFRLWCDGIHYFEIATVRGYDTGEVRMVANNSQGQVEGRATLEVYQAEDLRSVLHRAEKVPTTEKGDVELTVKRYRTSRSIEDQMRGLNCINVQQLI